MPNPRHLIWAPIHHSRWRRFVVSDLLSRVDGITGNSGKLGVLMPGGDACKGRWSSAAGAGITVGAGSLFSQYGSTYITGYSVSTGHGQNPGQALMVCASGRTIQVEFVTGAGTAHGFGLAKDNEANIYRLVF
jgi:hypothetical protein